MHHKICAAEHLVNNHDVGTFKPYPQTLYCADSILLPTNTSALSLTARTFTILGHSNSLPTYTSALSLTARTFTVLRHSIVLRPILRGLPPSVRGRVFARCTFLFLILLLLLPPNFPRLGHPHVAPARKAHAPVSAQAHTRVSAPT